MEWSNGVIFLIATFWLDGLCMAELGSGICCQCQGPSQSRKREEPYHTTPYAPSPTTSWMSYCSLTLKDILRDPDGFGGFERDMAEPRARWNPQGSKRASTVFGRDE
jgi:hypothetical protein